jgi:hypothetical protein
VKLKTLATALAFAAAPPALVGQTSPSVLLEIETRAAVFYIHDVYDESRWGTDASNRQRPVAPSFTPFTSVSDITSVNGRPAKGTLVWRARQLALAPTGPAAVADVIRGAIADLIFEILQEDGTPVGTIMASGFAGGTPPPGTPVTAPIGNWSPTGNNLAVVGGTGVFLGARGQASAGQNIVNGRPTSVAENPANRRIHGGGSHRYLLHVFPMFRPEVVMTPLGPAIFHQDFTRVSSSSPARPGEIVIVQARGLGPTRPGVNPGQPFPVESLQEVSSPVDAAVSALPAEVINKLGWPGEIDMYRIDVRIPEGLSPGTGALRFSVGFIPGPETTIALR